MDYEVWFKLALMSPFDSFLSNLPLSFSIRQSQDQDGVKTMPISYCSTPKKTQNEKSELENRATISHKYIKDML